jgi:hypothetical protein
MAVLLEQKPNMTVQSRGGGAVPQELGGTPRWRQTRVAEKKRDVARREERLWRNSIFESSPRGRAAASEDCRAEAERNSGSAVAGCPPKFTRNGNAAPSRFPPTSAASPCLGGIRNSALRRRRVRRRTRSSTAAVSLSCAYSPRRWVMAGIASRASTIGSRPTEPLRGALIAGAQKPDHDARASNFAPTDIAADGERAPPLQNPDNAMR